MDYFQMNLPLGDINRISVLGLAHIGDGVYELMNRADLCARGHNAVRELHALTVERVKAPAQARAAESILPSLTEEETAVYRRGRNTRVNSVPQHAELSEYHAATGLEALFGWLYLQGKTARLNELFALIAAQWEE